MNRLDMLERYKTIVFDCDGVLLNSNKIKTDAFREVALPYGADKADELVAYHRTRGGVSRYSKLEYFVHNILKAAVEPPEVDALVRAYATNVHENLMLCELTEGLKELRDRTAGKRWMIVSGGAQDELRQIFRRRGLDFMFDAGIFGSPHTKDEIFSREFRSSPEILPAMYLGDSRYDHEACRRAGLDFIFVSDWTEFLGWRDYCAQKSIRCIGRVSDLLL